MKKMKAILAFLAVMATASLGGAIWFPFIPLSDHSMAKSVDAHWNPIYRTYSFSTEDDQAVSWIRFARDLKPHEMEWRWYAPNGQLYARTFAVVPPKNFASGDWEGKTWSAIQIRGCEASRLQGTWRVDIFRDWMKIKTVSFNIGGQYVPC
ncbi:hypothetical protein [Methanothrix harundinacea]|jgi:hypothetical protein|uniref:Uncharacterized protein n=1 Tax=Methanothrix harundinacea (strain 6Ac) TaxID=1110509 RepID=G7WP23_METH6|nr:hypothetical protein [Methanothrix harundinacea]AET64864.1 hypothetical protein Mhar_1500 [Methanothrix harundinacea 6Ac]